MSAKRNQKKSKLGWKKDFRATSHSQRIRPEKMEGRRLRSRRTFLTFVLLFCALSPFVVRADEDNHEYKDGEVIPFLVNTIGPYANPSEIYGYYSLPVCAPPKEQRSPDRTFNLGESLEGDEFKKSLYVLKFKGSSILCLLGPGNETNRFCFPPNQWMRRRSPCAASNSPSKRLPASRRPSRNTTTSNCFAVSPSQANSVLVVATICVSHHWCDPVSDDLPVHGFIGTVDGDKHYLFTHVQFNVLYNKNQVRPELVIFIVPPFPLSSLPQHQPPALLGR